jgi:hypothetical protein
MIECLQDLLDTETGKLLLDPLAHAEDLGTKSNIGTDTVTRKDVELVGVLGQ